LASKNVAQELLVCVVGNHKKGGEIMETATQYAKRVSLKKFGSIASGTVHFVSTKYAIRGRQEAAKAAKMSGAPWAFAWWRPRKGEIARLYVRKGIEQSWISGRYEDFGLCGEAAAYLRE